MVCARYALELFALGALQFNARGEISRNECPVREHQFSLMGSKYRAYRISAPRITPGQMIDTIFYIDYNLVQ